MEYQGIITGIGNQNTNLITPEIDAIIYDFIISGNTVIDGFKVDGQNLSAGTCILCGYRGIMDKNITIDKKITGNYNVYGKFVLNFDKDILDEFSVLFVEEELTENVSPTKITQAGTYYLPIWRKSGSSPAQLLYPKMSHYSETTGSVANYGSLAENVTGITQPVNDNSTKIATTEYVQNQIEEEIDRGSFVGDIVDSKNTVLSTYTLQRIAGYVVGELTVVNKPSGTISGVLSNIPEGFRPTKTIYFNMLVKKLTNSASDYIYLLKCDTNGDIRVVFATTIGDLTTVDYTTKLTFGYKI